jgi:thiamine biosynthesis lipoprotein
MIGNKNLFSLVLANGLAQVFCACHILAPDACRRADAVMSVTVIAGNCLDADTLTTLVFALGPEKGWEPLNSLEVAGLIVDSAGQTIMSDAWVSQVTTARRR